jgi:hypothetical protein
VHDVALRTELVRKGQNTGRDSESVMKQEDFSHAVNHHRS